MIIFHMTVYIYIYTVESPKTDTPRSGQTPTMDKPCGTDWIYQACNYYLSSLREADNSLQRTEAMSPTCPLFGDSTVLLILFIYSRLLLYESIH